jgi:adenosylcobyric acid synthase
VTRLTHARVLGLPGVLAPAGGHQVGGYEIHAGITAVAPGAVAVAGSDGRALGAVSADGQVLGCYLHGLFANAPFRRGLLAGVGAHRGKHYRPTDIPDPDAGFDRVAAVLRSSLDLPRVFDLVGREFKW